MKELLEIRWPAVVLFIVFLLCLIGAPMAFLIMVPENIQHAVFSLPWMTIIAVGLPTLGVALHGLIAPFMRPVADKTGVKVDATTPPLRVVSGGSSTRRDGYIDPRMMGSIAAAGVLFLSGVGFLLAAGIILSSCGGSTAGTAAVVIGGAEIVVTGVCTGAEKLCEQNDPACGSGACHAFHTACPILSPSSPVQITCDLHPVVVPVVPVTSPPNPPTVTPATGQL